ncbi:G5 domain-containing protein [Bacillus benzoevorans]|uniref:G5 domain-containing protein n=1 Tax=Bacillus benzoevorans TaxID=1456 RepID=A0A7X0HTZ9_9BACI|nr:G5 domain-containing protein [Bacillus benzoevorans]MBB6445862.1 hypothetical protein [Bacillus benzoevorans]
MENKRDLKLILLMLLCTGFFFSFSIFGEQAYDRVSASKAEFQENTAIGPVDVSLLTSEGALKKLQQEQNTWMKQTTINLQYKEKKIPFDNSSFIFSPGKSIDGAASGVKNPLVVDVAGEMISAVLIDFAIEEGSFNRKAFIQELLSYPSTLQKGVHSIKLEDFLQEQQGKKVISEAAVTFRDNSEQMDLWVSQFPTVTIKPHSQFSIMDAVAEKGIKTFTSEGLSIAATAIYKAVLPTNFSITERSISRELPYYAEAGYEAKVDYFKNMDLIIANPNDDEYVLEFKQADNQLHVSLAGPELLYQYKIVLSEKETFKPKNIFQYDAKLAYGQQKVKTQGTEGFLQKVYRETVDSTGVTTDRELLSEDFYPPIHTVVLQSIQPKPEIPESEMPPGTGGASGTQTDVPQANANANTNGTAPQAEQTQQENNTNKDTSDNSYYMNHTK